MRTIHVGGFNPINRVKTLRAALEKAQSDDTILLHKNIKESVKITKDVIIDGNNKTLTVPEECVGLSYDNVQVELRNIEIKVPPRSIGIQTTSSVGGEFENVMIKLGGPIRKFTPAFILDGTGTYHLQNCEVKKLWVKESAKVEMDECIITSYYGPGIALSDMSDYSVIRSPFKITNSKIDHLFTAQHGFITDSELVTYNSFGDVLLTNVTLNMDDSILVNEKKEKKAGLLSSRTKSKFVVELTGATAIDGYKTGEVVKDFLGFYGNDGRITVRNTQNKSKKCQHLIRGGSISFKDTFDNSFYQIDNAATSSTNSEVRSNITFTSALNELTKLIGLNGVKKELNAIFTNIKATKGKNTFSNHMIFAGDPGTGKTTIARLAAEILYEIGAVATNNFAELSISDLVAGYKGQTAEKAKAALYQHKGGVIFIDEAYGLSTNGDSSSDFNAAALNELIAFMENNRQDTVVILAGYSKEMQDFLASNVGLSRRVKWIEFEDYDAREMMQIFNQMVAGANESVDGLSDVTLTQMFEKIISINKSIPDSNGRITNGGNGGLVRNVFEGAVTSRNNRLYGGDPSANPNPHIIKADVITGFNSEAKKANLRKTHVK